VGLREGWTRQAHKGASTSAFRSNKEKATTHPGKHGTQPPKAQWSNSDEFVPAAAATPCRIPYPSVSLPLTACPACPCVESVPLPACSFPVPAGSTPLRVWEARPRGGQRDSTAAATGEGDAQRRAHGRGGTGTLHCTRSQDGQPEDRQLQPEGQDQTGERERGDTGSNTHTNSTHRSLHSWRCPALPCPVPCAPLRRLSQRLTQPVPV
jgi:hypothetical protein